MVTKREAPPPNSSLGEALNASDDWTAVDARRERKKIQNRLNQRARSESSSINV
jgi:hypothetical protein